MSVTCLMQVSPLADGELNQGLFLPSTIIKPSRCWEVQKIMAHLPLHKDTDFVVLKNLIILS